MQLQMRYRRNGAEVTCRMFINRHQNGRPTHSGDLSFPMMDWPEVRARLQRAGVKLVVDDDPPNLDRGGKR
jgi:hypothetical protein